MFRLSSILVLSLSISFILSSCGERRRSAQNIANVQRGKQMILRIGEYTRQLGFRPPVTEAMLEAKRESGEVLLDRATYDRMLYVDPTTDQPVEWVYAPNAGYGEPMLISPEPHKGKLIVLFSDAAGKVMDVEDFEDQYVPEE